MIKKIDPQSVPKIKSLESAAEKEKELKKDLVAHILANMLHEHVQKHLETTTSSVSLPHAPKATLGAAPPFPDFPDGTPPSKSGLDPSVPSEAVGVFSNSGYLDKLNQFMDSLAADPSNPQTLADFITFLTNAQNEPPGHPAMQDARFTDLLNSAGIDNLLFGAMDEMIAIAFFNNFGGEAGAQKFMDQMREFLKGQPQDSHTQSMLDALNSFNLPAFAQEHADGKWTIYGFDYNWSRAGDSKIIMQYMFNLGAGGKVPNPYFGKDGLDLKAFHRNYMMEAFEDLVTKFKKNPEIILALWLVKMQDDHFQRQEQSLANTTNLLTDVTNDYATRILNLAQSIGPNFTPDQAKEFTSLYSDWTVAMNAQSQFSSLANGFNNGTVKAINDIMVTDPRFPQGQKVSLGALIQGVKNGTVSYNDLATALKSLPPAPPSGGEPGPSTSPNYQAFVTALQSGGGLVTGMSKTVSTQLSTVANVDNALMKFGHTIADSDGGGLAQLMGTIVKNQVSR